MRGVPAFVLAAPLDFSSRPARLFGPGIADAEAASDCFDSSMVRRRCWFESGALIVGRAAIWQCSAEPGGRVEGRTLYRSYIDDAGVSRELGPDVVQALLSVVTGRRLQS